MQQTNSDRPDRVVLEAEQATAARLKPDNWVSRGKLALVYQLESNWPAADRELKAELTRRRLGEALALAKANLEAAIAELESRGAGEPLTRACCSKAACQRGQAKSNGAPTCVSIRRPIIRNGP